jgi:acyl-CoA thioesterase-1
MSSLHRSALVLTTVLVTAGVVALGGYAYEHADRAAASPPGTSPAGTAQTAVTVVGDSITAGQGLSPDAAWPVLLGQDMHVDVTDLGCSAAGFVAVGNGEQCATDYDGLVAYTAATAPDVVLVQASSNDLGQDEGSVRSAIDDMVTDVHHAVPHARIVGLSAVWAEQDPPAQLAAMDTDLAAAVHGVHGTFVDVGQPFHGHPELMQSDDVHPTADGQRVLERATAAALRKAHVRL